MEGGRITGLGKESMKQIRFIRWTPNPKLVAIRDHGDYMRVLLHSCYGTVTRRGAPASRFRWDCWSQPLASWSTCLDGPR